MPSIRRFATKLKEEKQKFDDDKQELEQSGLMGSLRSGRIDVFDEARAAIQGWYHSLGHEKDVLRQMKEMFEVLDNAVDRVVRNKDEYRPSSSSWELEKKYYTILKDFLTAATKGKGNSDPISTSGAYVKIKAKILEDPKLQEKVKAMAESRKKGSVGSKASIELLAHGIETVSDAQPYLDKATREINRTDKNDDRRSKYAKAMRVLIGQVQPDFRKLLMEMTWIKRSTDESLESTSRIVESSRPIRDSGESDKKMYEKKLKKFQGSYAGKFNTAIDTLIDIRDSVDSEHKTRVITPREKTIYISMQKILAKGFA